MTIKQIRTWLDGKGQDLKSMGVSTELRETPASGPKPAVVGEMASARALGRITGWITGEFQFEVIRIDDEATVFDRRVQADSADQLEDYYDAFKATLTENEGI